MTTAPPGNPSTAPNADAISRAREVLALCDSLGFAAAGIAPPEPSRRAREIREWLAAGKHATMRYLAEDLDLRLDPARLLPGARAFVMVADLYAPRGPAADPPAPPDEVPVEIPGRIARYARGRDYHAVIKRRLHALADTLRERFPAERFRSFVDTVPVMERELAALAGLGWQGKHTLLIHPRLGSYMLLAGLATTLDLAPPPEQPPSTDHCGTCTRCIDACPTGAITPYSVDASRCISYLTIEREEPIPREFHAAIGDNLVGCDICQDVCPHNSARTTSEPTPRIHADYTPRRAHFNALDAARWSENQRRFAFQTSAMKRLSLAMMKRNALIVLANAYRTHRDPCVRAVIEDAAWDASEPGMVRETARQVLADASAS